MKLFADDRFALQSIQKLPTMYKELYMVSFANWKMQEMWYASRRESSVLQVGNCQKEDMNLSLNQCFFNLMEIVLECVWR
uniref:Putative ovule protein n=1 Tax=Solanum chacoense TaxID=4108 RepID=A0A0V0GLF7_SOLCH